MPQLGETVAEGKIVKWFKSAGDAVKPGDNLFEIETDKTSMEVPATFAGTLSEIRFQVGEVAKVGAVVAVIAGAGESAQARLPAAAPAKAPAPRQRRRPPRRWPRCRPRRTPRTTPLDPFREVRTPERNFGPAKLSGGDIHHAAGAAARRRTRHRSVARHRLRPAWPHRRRRRRDGRRRPRPRWPPAPAPRRSRRCTRASLTKKCRSTGCARPSPSGWSRPSRPSRISI